MIKAPISLQDLRRRLYAKAKSERRHRKVCIQDYVRPHNPTARPQRTVLVIL